MAFWLQEKLACLPAELHTVAGRQEDIQCIPAKFLKKEVVNVHNSQSSAVSSLKGILDFFSALSCLWLFPSCYFQGEKKTGKLPHSNIFSLNLTFSWIFFFLLANDGHSNKQKVIQCPNIKKEISKFTRLIMKRRYKPLSETVMLQVFLFLPRNYPPTPEQLLGADIEIVCYQKAMMHLLQIAMKVK